MGIPLRVIPSPDVPISAMRLPPADDQAALDSPGSGASLQPGDMWREPDLDGQHGECWAVVLPNRTVWYSTITADSGAYWTVTGEPPCITVTPSIDDRDPKWPWHGWITGGELKKVGES